MTIEVVDTLDGDVRFREGLEAIWAKSRPGYLESIESILSAFVPELAGPEELVGAAGAAHRLAGTLGIFGLGDSSRAALRIEQVLNSSGAVSLGQARSLVELAESIKAAIESHEVAVR